MSARSLRQNTPHISRSQGISRSVRQGKIGSKNATLQKGPKTVGVGNRERNAGTQSLKQNRSTAIQKSVLRNQAFVNAAKGSNKGNRDQARSNFRGQFAGKHIGDPRWAHFDRRHRHFFVTGWLGPVFWPYFYDDYLDYTYWPYEYDTFWPYAYDDVYVSVFGPYAYAGNAYASAPAYREGRRVQRVPAGGVAQVCSFDATTLTDWPIERITQRIELDDQQRGLLDELKNATNNAVEEMRSACPKDLPGTPTARIAAMRARIDAMLKALTTIQPALERFYGSLSDEQKARFDAIPDDSQRSRAATRTNAGDACNTQSAGSFPIERIRSTIRPSQDQEAALDELEEASRSAAERLKADCESEQNLTAPARVEAMQRRLKGTLDALDKLQPALDRFYGSLSDEQKARFNRLSRQA